MRNGLYSSNQNLYSLQNKVKVSFPLLCLFDGFEPFQMTPLFDATITNIKLATHGQLDAMNAVLISSVAASTFNTQLEAWEPLVEPFDGIFKYHMFISLLVFLFSSMFLAFSVNLLEVMSFIKHSCI